MASVWRSFRVTFWCYRIWIQFVALDWSKIILYLVNTSVYSVEQWVTMMCRLFMFLTQTSLERNNGVAWRKNEWTRRGRSKCGGRGCDDRRVVTACCLLADLYRGESTCIHMCKCTCCMYMLCVFIHAINYVHCRHSRRTLCVHTAMLFMRSRVHAIRMNVIRSTHVSLPLLACSQIS